jgi:(1->4)-alpha-D-glucan 1-alpha-D-glucosylmutase
VGGEPGRRPEFDPVEEFHARNERTQRDWPDTMNATSTHDTKRSEDMRARISVISEIPEVWQREVRRWTQLNARHRTGAAPDPNEELLLYQTVLGMWSEDVEVLDDVPDRLRAYLEKASREAKMHTSWLAPNPEFEKAYLDYATEVAQSEEFRRSMLRFYRRISFHGYLNGLSQLVLKIGSPGAPDFYQGSEVWDFSLVDPDNRRPVDYEHRKSMLKKIRASAERGSLDLDTMMRRMFDGRIKMYVTWRGLDLRKRRVETFQRGDYTRLPSRSPHVVAFSRGSDVIVAAPRLTTKLVKTGVQPIGEAWGDTVIEGVAPGPWKNIFTGETLDLNGTARLADVFAKFPVAMLERVVN